MTIKNKADLHNLAINVTFKVLEIVKNNIHESTS